MAKIPIALIGVNLIENENVFLGALVKFNVAKSALILVKESEIFSDQINGLIKKIKEYYKQFKKEDFSSVFNKLRNESNVRFLLYATSISIADENVTITKAAEETQKQYMRVFTNTEILQDEEREIKIIKPRKK